MNNQRFAETNAEFRQDCEAANIPPTRRQASKYRMGKGRAYQAKLQRLKSTTFKLFRTLIKQSHERRKHRHPNATNQPSQPQSKKGGRETR